MKAACYTESSTRMAKTANMRNLRRHKVRQTLKANKLQTACVPSRTDLPHHCTGEDVVSQGIYFRVDYSSPERVKVAQGSNLPLRCKMQRADMPMCQQNTSRGLRLLVLPGIEAKPLRET